MTFEHHDDFKHWLRDRYTTGGLPAVVLMTISKGILEYVGD